MEEEELGPNGGMVRSIESVLEKSEQVKEKIDELLEHKSSLPYTIFDFPGQIELYAHYPHLMHALLNFLQDQCGISICVCHLSEASHFYLDPFAMTASMVTVLQTCTKFHHHLLLFFLSCFFFIFLL